MLISNRYIRSATSNSSPYFSSTYRKPGSITSANLRWDGVYILCSWTSREVGFRLRSWPEAATIRLRVRLDIDRWCKRGSSGMSSRSRWKTGETLLAHALPCIQCCDVVVGRDCLQTQGIEQQQFVTSSRARLMAAASIDPLSFVCLTISSIQPSISIHPYHDI